MPTPILALYGVFLLAVAAILIFSGRVGRRQLILALACGGVITFALEFIYAGLPSGQMIFIQLIFFPLVVLTTWTAMFLVSRFKNR